MKRNVPLLRNICLKVIEGFTPSKASCFRPCEQKSNHSVHLNWNGESDCILKIFRFVLFTSSPQTSILSPRHVLLVLTTQDYSRLVVVKLSHRFSLFTLLHIHNSFQLFAHTSASDKLYYVSLSVWQLLAW